MHVFNWLISTQHFSLDALLYFDDVSDAKFVEDVLLHWRYYRDVPEFFTCFFGECDGEHWGMLLDEPSKGFCGAASYYNNDGDLIQVYQSLFDAVLTRCEQAIEHLLGEDIKIENLNDDKLGRTMDERRKFYMGE